MILVTGGTGLVGSHLLLELLKEGKNIRAIHRKDSDLQAVKKIFSYYTSSQNAEDLFNKIDWIEAELSDIPALTNAFTGINQVYHCAALISFEPSDEKDLRKTNIEGTANIVNLCIANNIAKLCYISSIATMDLQIGEDYISENFVWYPEKNHNEYAITKHGAETEVWRGTQEGLPAIILNPGVIIGPGNWNSGSGLIFKKIYQGLKYHFPKTTGFVGVKDVARFARLAMESDIKNEQYILVSENLKFKDVLNSVADSLQKTRPTRSLKPWMVKIGYIYQSILHHITGYKRTLNYSDHKGLFEDKLYSNKKAKSELNIEFTPINKVIQETGELFLKEK